MQLLDVLAEVLPIADVPEYVIRKYLAGDRCLDYCDTIHVVFTKKFTGTKNGCEYTFLDEQCTILHSFDDMPGKISACGDMYWYKNGKRHRDKDQPAVIVKLFDDVDEDQIVGIRSEWCINGKLHRDNDKPANIYSNGSREWYKYGKLHRDGDEPAVIYQDWYKAWYKDGKLHRYNDQRALIYRVSHKYNTRKKRRLG